MYERPPSISSRPCATRPALAGAGAIPRWPTRSSDDAQPSRRRPKARRPRSRAAWPRDRRRGRRCFGGLSGQDGVTVYNKESFGELLWGWQVLTAVDGPPAALGPVARLVERLRAAALESGFEVDRLLEIAVRSTRPTGPRPSAKVPPSSKSTAATARRPSASRSARPARRERSPK